MTSMLLSVMRLLITCAVAVSASACGAENWSWKPYVVSVTYSKNRQAAQTIHFFERGTGLHSDLCILIDEGQQLRIEEITYALLPGRHQLGVEVVRFNDMPDLAKPEDRRQRIRLRATVRKYWGKKPKGEWYDEKDEFVSRWLDVGTDERELTDFHPLWRVGKDWDYLRIQVESKPKNCEPSSIVSEWLVALKPTKGQLKWNIGHNVFNWLWAEHPGVVKVFFAVSAALVVVGMAVLIVAVRRAR